MSMFASLGIRPPMVRPDEVPSRLPINPPPASSPVKEGTTPTVAYPVTPSAPTFRPTQTQPKDPEPTKETTPEPQPQPTPTETTPENKPSESSSAEQPPSTSHEEPASDSSSSENTPSSTDTSTTPQADTQPSESSTKSSSSSSGTSAIQSSETTLKPSSNTPPPGLIRGSSTPGPSSTVAAGAANVPNGSGLSGGAIAGIVVGVLVLLAIIAVFATRFFRKRSRAARTAHRSSMYDGWQSEPPREKQYPMQAATANLASSDTSSFHTGYPAQYSSGHSEGSAAQIAGGAAPMGTSSPMSAHYPVSVSASSPTSMNMAGAGAGAAVAAAGLAATVSPDTPLSPNATGVTQNGLHDGMMTRVKVGFVRSLEDELAITQGQQLYLHNTYDDGWCLCEDDSQNRGVVPISCLEPWP